MRKVYVGLFIVIAIVCWRTHLYAQQLPMIQIPKEGKQPLIFMDISKGNKQQMCVAKSLIQDENSEVDQSEPEPQIEPQDQNQNLEPPQGSQNPTIPSNPKQNCRMVYVIDSPEVQQQGHYEIIHHEAITKVERYYVEYIEYRFYRDDGSYEVKRDYDQSFSADQYLAAHPEFCRYTFSKGYDEEKRTVVVQPAYDEEVYIIDVPYQPEIGHYQQICD